MFAGPIGSQVVLQNKPGDDLTVTVPTAPAPDGPLAYFSAPIRFATAQPDGESYSVTIKSQPIDQVCAFKPVPTGLMPAATEALMLGCERRHDLVSLNDLSATPAEGSSTDRGGFHYAVIGGNTERSEGRFVAFVSYDRMAGSGGALRQVFWHDRFTGRTVLVSKNAAGLEGNGESDLVRLSADGLHVAFRSAASNLVTGDSNGNSDVFVWSAAGGVFTRAPVLVSAGAGGAAADGPSGDPSISADGNVVAFASDASNLTPGVINTENIFVRRMDTGVTKLVSVDRHGLSAGFSGKPALSESGTRLAFYSYSDDLAANDTKGLWDIFLADLGAGARKCMSRTASGVPRTQGGESISRVVEPAISGDGRYVAFATTAGNMVPGDGNGKQDVFVVDSQTDAVVRASIASDGAEGNDDSPIGQGEAPSLSYDGTWLAFSTLATNLGAPAGNVMLRNLRTGQRRWLSTGSANGVGKPSLSRNAIYAIYRSDSALDLRFPDFGVFTTFTGVGKAYFWW